MASISGMIGKIDKKTLEAMSQALAHRGQEVRDTYEDGLLGLSHGRSSLERGSGWQEPVYILWDGQIFNDDRATGESTASYLLRRYQAEGLDFIADLNGDFALAIYDKTQAKVYLVRDRFGSKPLYYTKNTQGGEILFASECKAFLEVPSFVKKFNPAPLKAYLELQYVPESESFFQDVYALAAGHYLEIDCRTRTLVEKEYYFYDFAPDQLGEPDKKRALKKSLERAVDRRRPEGRFATFLSSGVDSSLITALAQPDITLTVAYEHKEALFDEGRHARALSEHLGIPHRSLTLTGDLAFSNFHKIQFAADNPLGNLSAIPLYYLAQMGREETDLVLTGEGADELFGGYASYVDGPSMRRYKKLPFGLRRLLAQLAKRIPTSKAESFVKAGSRVEDYFVGESKVFSQEKAEQILQPAYGDSLEATDYMKPWYERIQGGSDLQKMQLIDLYTFMPSDIFVKADRMLNQAQLTARMPFLDRELIDFSRTLQDKEKVQAGVAKRLLREVAEEIIPLACAQRKKLGFPVPLRHWLREEKIYNQVREAFLSPTASQFFVREEILALLEDHKAGRSLNQRMIYVLYAFLVWYEEYFIKR